MTLPPRKQVSIDGRRWKVEVVAGCVDDDGKPMSGLCDYVNRTLFLNASDVGMEDDFLHEALHAMDQTLSEKQVANLERALYSFRVANPTMWTWTFDRDVAE